MKAHLIIVSAALAAMTLAACGGESATTDDTKAVTTGAAEAEATTAAATESTVPGPFKVKSGIVESTIDMMGEQKQTMYFDDFGRKQTLVTAMEIMGQKSESITINADGFTITYDPVKKEGTKRAMPAGATASMVPNLESLTADVKERYKLKEIDDRSIAGKDAQGYEMEAMGMPMKVWLWEGVPMRTEVSLGGDKPMISEVTSLQTDVEIPADRFSVPADVKLTEN